MKFAILFCLVAFACVAHASYVKEDDDKHLLESLLAKLEAAKQKVDKLINKALDLLKGAIAQVKQTAQAILDKLQSGAAKISNNVKASINKILDNLDARVAKLVEYESKGVDVEECVQLTKPLRKTALGVISDVNDCLDKKVQQGKNLVKEINDKSDAAVGEVLIIQAVADQCVVDIKGKKAIEAAIGCVKRTAVQAYWALTKQVPRAILNLSKLTATLSLLPPSLPSCVPKNAVLNIAEESRVVLNKVKVCINEKVGYNPHKGGY